jgi:hypothetical protein
VTYRIARVGNSCEQERSRKERAILYLNGYPHSAALTTLTVTEVPTLYTFDLTLNTEADDNPDLALRITFEQGEGGTVGNNRFDNLTVEGFPLPGVNLPPGVVVPVANRFAIEAGEPVSVDLDGVFNDPENDPMTYSVSAQFTNVVDASVSGNLVTLIPLDRGDAVITVSADDGNNPPTEHTFRLLVYPAAHAQTNSPFAFTQWDSNTAARVYPENMIFLQSDQSDTGIDTPLDFAYDIPLDDYHNDDAATLGFPYNNTSRTRLNGLDDQGLSFINTGRGRDLGGALIALDTRGVTNVNVSWLGGTVLANTRIYAIRLQWRAGIEAPFVDVLDSNNDPVEYIRVSDGHLTAFDPVALPPAALDEPHVQLLWRYYRVSGTSGARAMLRLDDIAVEADIAPPVLLSTYPSMFLRGSFNAWANDAPMTLIDDYTWQRIVTFAEDDPDPRFKFDVFGDWTVNFGDNEEDGFADDPDGDNILVPGGPGSYRITFNDDTKAYTLEALTAFNLWQAGQFTPGELANPTVSGPFADPTDSGIDNLLRFAWGLERDDPYEDALPRAEIDLADPLFIYRRLIDPNSGVLYEMDVADDLLADPAWREAVMGIDLIDTDTTEPTGDGLTEEVTLTVPPEAIDPLRGIRLRVRETP